MVIWLGYLDSNQGNARFRVWCLTAWLYPNFTRQYSTDIMKICQGIMQYLAEISLETLN